MTNRRELLTIDEVAQWLRTTPNALRVQRHRREGPGALAVKVGRRLLWDEAAVMAWLKQQSLKAEELRR